MKSIICTALTLFLVTQLLAQIQLKGMVTFKNEPLSAATVYLKNTTCGAFTDDEGKFQFTCDKPGTTPFTIAIRYTKFKPASVEFSSLEEAASYKVIVAYKTKRKYAVSKVKL